MTTHTLRAHLPLDPAAPAHPPITDPDILQGYLQDASRLVGFASSLYRPESESELATLLRTLAHRGTPVTVVARQTSTTGSSVPMGGAIISMEKLNHLLEIDPIQARARAQGGILLGDFQRLLEAQGLLYPPDPTSRNESTLGASVACNASGARTFKYGPTRPYVERLRVVLSEGYILDMSRGQTVADDTHHIRLELPDGRQRDIPCPSYPRPTVKHAAGYHSGDALDVIDLFIGSEGTLGVISEVEVRLLPLPEKVISILATFPSEATAFQFVRACRAQAQAGGLEPRCLEWLDVNALHIIGHRFPDPALPPEAQAAVFFEQECTAEQEMEMLEGWYARLVELNALVDAENGVIVADTEARQQLLYDMRHAVPAVVNERAAHNRMPKLGTDLSVPDDALETMMAIYSAGVRDVPGALGPSDCVRVMLQACGERGPLVDSLHAASREGGTEGERLPAALLLEAVERLDSLMGSTTSGSLPERIAAHWDQLELPHSFEYAIFGHIGNNHVHVNLLPKNAGGLLAARRLYERWTERAISMGGSVSGEHGIGKNKRAALEALLGPEAIAQMRAVKQALDPSGVLGQGNLFTSVAAAPPVPPA